MSPTNQDGEIVFVTEENFNEKDYLVSNPDVALAVRQGKIFSGWRHFKQYGKVEGRSMRVSPSDTGGG
jgi:hypothetical protein